MRWLTAVTAVSLAAFSLLCSAQAGDKDKKGDKTPKKDLGTLTIVAAPGGKELKVTDWRFTQGTRPFSLDGEAPVKPKTKNASAPEYLEFRDEKSTTYKNGIFTLIPLASLKKLTYDREKKTVAAVVVTDGNEDVTLTGTTKFGGSNRVTIEAEIDIGLGLASESFQGGVEKGVHSFAFAKTEPVVKAKGTPATVLADDKDKSKHSAFDVLPLYQVDGAYRTAPFLMFKKTVKIDMDKIESMRFVQSAGKKDPGNSYEVTLKDGNKHTLTLLTTIDVDEKKLTLIGMVGRAPVGYKLFSLDAIYEYRAGADEKK